MISRFHLAVATTLLAANISSVTMSDEIAKRWRNEEDSQKTLVYKGNRERSRSIVREKQNNESDGITWRESTMEELASATGFARHAGLSNKEQNSAKKREKNRLSISDRWQDDVPGTSGLDYPNHSVIPVTSFSCSDKNPGGYYADAETGCQVFHVCNNGGVKSSFLCPPGSVFNQKYLVCDWWYSVDCVKADDLVSSRLAEDSKDWSQRPDYGNYREISSSPIVMEYLEEIFTPMIVKYSKETTTVPDDSTTNDLSQASGAGRKKFSLTKQSIEKDDRLPIDLENNNNNIIDRVDSNVWRSLESHEKRDDRIDTPRGFSRYSDDKSLIGKTIDQASQTLTNDLATYVNYAYFESRPSQYWYDNHNNNGDSNGGDGDRN